MSKVAVIVGVGPGNGAAFARRFAAEGYAVALLARDEARLVEFEKEIAGSKAYACDVTEPAEIKAVFAAITADLGPVNVLVYNAGAGSWSTPDETTAEDMERSWRINALGCLLAAQEVAPAMREAGAGAIVVIGATASKRGGVRTTAFASAKAAQLSLAQSMAKHWGPAGIHAAYLVIDGVIDLPRTRDAMPDAPDSFFLKPADIAETVYTIAHQPKSAWTFELDIRPFGEKW